MCYQYTSESLLCWGATSLRIAEKIPNIIIIIDGRKGWKRNETEIDFIPHWKHGDTFFRRILWEFIEKFALLNLSGIIRAKKNYIFEKFIVVRLGLFQSNQFTAPFGTDLGDTLDLLV